jgi:iron complex transport system substrate-binding protein
MFPGAGERLVGVGLIDQGKGNFLREIDPTYEEKTILERNVGPEQIAALRPDLVLMKSFLRARLGAAVERLGIPVLYLDLETPEQYERDITTLGDVLGLPERARVVNGFFRGTAERVLGRTRELPQETRPRVLFLYATARGGQIAFSVPPRGWMQSRLVQMAGGRPVWIESAVGEGWITVGLEQVAAWNADHVFLVSYRQDVDQTKNEILNDARWAGMKATADRKIHAFPVDFYSWDQPDTRWILGLQWMARILHPALFEGWETRSLVLDFFGRMYGLAPGGIESVIFSRLQGDLD